MVQVRFNASARRFPVEMVNEDMTVRAFLESKGAQMNAMFSINGAIVTRDNLEMTFAELVSAGYANVLGEIMIQETIKTDNAAR